MLEVRRGAAIRSFRNPLIAHPHFRAAGIDHRFDRDDHAFLQTRAAAFFPVVRQVGLVMHSGADAMPNEFPHHRKTVLLDPALHRVADVAEAVTGAHLIMARSSDSLVTSSSFCTSGRIAPKGTVTAESA